MAARVLGAIANVPVGTEFPSRAALAQAGVHRPLDSDDLTVISAAGNTEVGPLRTVPGHMPDPAAIAYHRTHHLGASIT